MNVEITDDSVKPENWPANNIECLLENVYLSLFEFLGNPNYKNKEILVSLISNYDLNQRSHLGLVRTTDYEVSIMNSIFIQALFMNLQSLKSFVYEIISEKTRMQLMIGRIDGSTAKQEIDEYVNLMPQLKLYHIVYQFYCTDKDMTLSEKLIETVKLLLANSKQNDSENKYIDNLLSYTRSYVAIVNDLSYINCAKLVPTWALKRDEIQNVFKFMSELIKEAGDSPCERPLKGVLMTSISNYILKSRNGYNKDYICKYLPELVVNKSILNHEIWMSKIENLNDEREMKVVPNLLNEGEDFGFDWVKQIDFTPTRKYYVSCFSKHLNDQNMLENYGPCIYGYKNDRLNDLLSPIYVMFNEKGESRPFFSQVVAFDVIYNTVEAKEEIRFLCEIIDYFSMSSSEKKSFFEEIMQYWILSVKDAKWSYERERRFVLFMYDDYNYIEAELEGNMFIKLKSTVFILPDFILGRNPKRRQIKYNIDNKRKAIASNPYLYCLSCLSVDYDAPASGDKINICPICGSNEIILEER